MYEEIGRTIKKEMELAFEKKDYTEFRRRVEIALGSRNDFFSLWSVGIQSSQRRRKAESQLLRLSV